MDTVRTSFLYWFGRFQLSLYVSVHTQSEEHTFFLDICGPNCPSWRVGWSMLCPHSTPFCSRPGTYGQSETSSTPSDQVQLYLFTVLFKTKLYRIVLSVWKDTRIRLRPDPNYFSGSELIK